MSELVELERVEPVVFTEVKANETVETKEEPKDIVVEPKEEPKKEPDTDPLSSISVDEDELKETLDELQCIKKELADIKKDTTETDNNVVTDDTKEVKKEEKDVKVDEKDAAVAKEGTETNRDESFGRDDLIAMLGGCEETQEKTVSSTNDVTSITEDVEIEGEGSFQIMEVVDDDMDDIEAAVTDTLNATPKTSTVVTPSVSTTVPKLTVSSTNTKSITLTLEQERAIAMEQMADISFKRIPRNKAATSTTGATVTTAAASTDDKDNATETDKTSLLQVLGADWSDDDAHDKAMKLQNKAVTIKPKAKAIKKEPATSNKSGTTIAVVTKETVKAAGGSAAAKSVELEHLKTKEKPIITSVVVLNQTSPTKKKIENGTDVKDKKETKQPAGTAASGSQPSGFKRQRIIKRKIIWDPDAPETAISYAQLARSSTSKSPSINATSPAVKKETAAVAATSTTVIKKGASSGHIAMLKQESKKPASPSSSVNSPLSGTEIVIETTGSKVVKQINEAVGTVTKSPLVFDDSRCVTPAAKRRSQTPIANGGLSNKKKKVSEVDRLMGDEGAINMLNAVENELNNKQKDNKEVGEVAQETSPKHNMRSRGGTAEKGATKREALASSQKKDTPMPSKAKRQPRSKASATWDYVYQSQQDESMIIRRRSNSSYSSNASLHRLSLDGGPSPITPKVEQKKTAPTSTKAKSKTTVTSATSTSIITSSSSPSPVGSAKKSAFEFAKPKNKSNAAEQQTATTPKGNRRNNKSNAAGTSPQLINESSTMRNVSGNIDDENVDFVVSVAVHKFDDVWQLEFSSKATKLSVEMLDQLTDALNRLKTANDCSVVVMSTTRANFCQGIDLSDLLTENNEKRSIVASQIATAVKMYLKALATFPKPIVAAVNGNVSGLGVMQLLLLDGVIAGDKSYYETSIYNKIGQVPEGYCIWENDRKISKNLFKKLLWFGEKVSAYEAQSWGLLYKIMPAAGVLEEAKTLAKKLATTKMYNSMKKQSIDRFMTEVDKVLDKEFKTIAEQLSSYEVFEKLKKN